MLVVAEVKVTPDCDDVIPNVNPPAVNIGDPPVLVTRSSSVFPVLPAVTEDGATIE
ncbi:MAG: hypothetical protein U0794_18890 [Isosphaeraceae bacterium]